MYGDFLRCNRGVVAPMCMGKAPLRTIFGQQRDVSGSMADRLSMEATHVQHRDRIHILHCHSFLNHCRTPRESEYGTNVLKYAGGYRHRLP